MGSTISRFGKLGHPQKALLVGATSYLLRLLYLTKSIRLSKLKPLVLVSSFLCLQYDLPLSHVPWTLYLIRNRKATKSHYIMAAVWSAYSMALTKIISMGQLEMRHGWWLSYISWISIMGFKKASPVPTFYEKLIIRMLWDPPLTLAILVGRLFGIHVLDDGNGKFISIIDENIVISSMPTAWDIAEIRSKKNNVLSVINMQTEWKGPIQAYKKAGIEQLRLPTLDTFPPALEDLKEGVKFIKRRLKDHPDSRILIHCKGGRARAVTMALAYYISEGMNPEKAFERIKKVRSVAVKGVLKYQVIKDLIKEKNK